MANEQNLLKSGDLTPKQRRENASKAGKASAAARRQRKTLAENMKLLLNMPVTNPDDWNDASMMGIQPEEITNAQLLVIAMFREAKSGNVNAFKEIRAMIGEENVQSEEQIKKLDAVLEQIGGVI